MTTSENRAARPVVANISNRHIHLSAVDCEKLFGPGYTLKKLKDLMQPGEHACRETLKIVGGKGEIDSVRVLGPLRARTQVEISLTDSFRLGLKAPVRQSGHTEGSSPVTIIGPQGSISLPEGCIVAQRHVHMTVADAAFYGVANNALISVRCHGPRGLVFENVVARVSDTMVLECHLDTDEGNAAAVRNGDMVTIV